MPKKKREHGGARWGGRGRSASHFRRDWGIRPSSPICSGMLTLADVLMFLIEKGPGRTEAELAEAIFGDRAYQQRVKGECRLLVDRGRIERRGTGPSDPFKYFPILSEEIDPQRP